MTGETQVSLRGKEMRETSNIASSGDYTAYEQLRLGN